MLRVENLTVSIDKKIILDKLSIAFAPHKRTAIIGPNGAGKSTLLKTIAGLNNKYSGKVWLDDCDIKKIARQKLAQKMAILPQGVTAPPDVTVAELVDYGRFPYRGMFLAANPKLDREVAAWAMEVTHTIDFAARKVATLSGGERQRAFLAMTLAQQPEILLLDEPTTYLDIAHQLEVMEIIAAINSKYNLTVIMVLHDINHALQYADELAVLKNKQIIKSGAPENILTIDMLADVFGVKADIFTNSQGRKVLSPIALCTNNSKK